MKKIIILSLACIVLLTSCTQKPQSNSNSQPQSQSQSKAQSGSSSVKEELKIPSSVPHTKTGIEGEDAKYPVEKLDGKLHDLTNEDIEKYAGVAFSYAPLPALDESEGSGIRLYEIMFENGEMTWKYGKVESEYIHSYKGYYVLVQDGVIEAILTNTADEEDIMEISFRIKVPQKQNDKDVVLQARMLSCTNNFFADMSDLLLVYHDKVII